MPTASISSPDGRARLEIAIDETEPRYDARWSVRLETDSLRATHGFWSGAEPEHLVEYFAGLAENWRGWEGAREFTSIEHDFQLSATHDGRGHIELWVTLGTETSATPPMDWLARACVALEAGGLDELVRDLRPLIK